MGGRIDMGADDIGRLSLEFRSLRPLRPQEEVLRAVRRAFRMSAGLAGGALGIVVVVRLLRDLLYGVSPFDPVALGLAALLACATVALLVPVRRATRVDPAAALRAQ